MLGFNPESVENIIQEVAEAEILPRFHNLKEGDVAFKGVDNPVTIADKEAEKALSIRLLDLLPGSKVVGEEEFASDPGIVSRFSGESPVWTVDPVDGTKPFMEGKETFGVIVSLVERNQAIAGWLYHPISKEFVTAEKGAGAYHKGVKLRVLPSEPLEKMVGNVECHTSCPSKLLAVPKGLTSPKLDEAIKSCCHEYPRMVVAAPHFARPPNRWHFWGRLAYCTPWDDTAGLLIHQEAGGFAAHWNGDLFNPSTSYGRGFVAAPDRASWEALRDWVGRFHELV